MAVLPKELIFMTAVCDSVKEVAVWAKHANSKEVCLPLKDSGPPGSLQPVLSSESSKASAICLAPVPVTSKFPWLPSLLLCPSG